jgi:hypothetical protein
VTDQMRALNFDLIPPGSPLGQATFDDRDALARACVIRDSSARLTTVTPRPRAIARTA